MAISTNKSTVIRHPRFGLAAPALKWVPAPRYLLRRDAILRVVDSFPAGSMLELGCGSGALLGDMAERGFSGIGVDQSESARRIAQAILKEVPGFQVLEDHSSLEEASFDYLSAFEVLEHIEDDHAALLDWARLLKPGGHLLVSVPAHPERWNPADVWAGHYRRYRREDLTDLVKSAGFKLHEVQSYGYPLANLMERFSARIYAKQTERRGQQLGRDKRTEESGSDRSILTRLWPFYSSIPGVWTMRFMQSLQNRSLNTDKGVGYLAIGQKL